MNRLSIYIFLACFACIIGSGIAIAALPTQTPVPVSVLAQQTISPTFVPTSNVPILGTFTVIATTLYIRNTDLEVVGNLHDGERVQCYLTSSGWCMMEQGRRVWSGCLEPNPQELGCEAK